MHHFEFSPIILEGLFFSNVNRFSAVWRRDSPSFQAPSARHVLRAPILQPINKAERVVELRVGARQMIATLGKVLADQTGGAPPDCPPALSLLPAKMDGACRLSLLFRRFQKPSLHDAAGSPDELSAPPLSA